MHKVRKHLMLHLLKKIAKLATALIVGLYISIWVLSPYVANHLLSPYLQAQQLELTAESTIRYNPFLSRLSIKELALSRAADPSVSDSSGKVFQISELTVEIALHRLFFEQVSITEFAIDGLYITINKDTDLLNIAGINIPLGHQVDSEKRVLTGSAGIPQHSNLPFQLVMSKMKLINSRIDIIEQGQLHQLHLTDVSINEVKATESKQDLSVTVIADLDGAEVILSAAADMHGSLGEINVEVELSDVDVNKFTHFSSPYVEKVTGSVSYHGIHNIKLTEEGISIDIIDLAFSGQNLAVNKNDLHLSLEQQEFKSDYLAIRALADSDVNITTVGELLLQNINIYNKTEAQALMAVQELLLDGIGINNEQGQYKLTVNNTMILDSIFSDNTDNELPALTQFKALNIKDIVLTEKALIVDTIELAGLKGDVQLDKHKVLKNLIISKDELLLALEGTKGNEKQLSDEEIFSIKLNNISLVDNAEIQFLDSSISPSYNRSLTVTHLSAGPFDNQLADQKSIIKIKGSSNQYANFDVTVNAKPFLNVPSYDMEGQFKEINLPGLSVYVKQALGYEIESGQLDLGITAELSGTKIEGEAKVLLRGVNLVDIDGIEDTNSDGQTAIPFSVALTMLEDDDGNVELDLPLSGDTSNPSFGLSGLLKVLITKATIIGTREYLAQVLIPYAGLVTVVMVADKHIIKMEIKNLEYPAASVDVPSEHEVFLSDFIALMEDNSELHIKLCGVASATDIEKKNGSDISSKEDNKALLAIARQRGKNFKAYMVEEQEIDSSRLLLCTPQIDSSEGAIPHIKFET